MAKHGMSAVGEDPGASTELRRLNVKPERRILDSSFLSTRPC